MNNESGIVIVFYYSKTHTKNSIDVFLCGTENYLTTFNEKCEYYLNYVPNVSIFGGIIPFNIDPPPRGRRLDQLSNDEVIEIYDNMMADYAIEGKIHIPHKLFKLLAKTFIKDHK